MAELQQIALADYEKQKQAYGFNDEQMKQILGLEPVKTRWADGPVVMEEEEKDKQEMPSVETQNIDTEIKEEIPNKEELSLSDVQDENPQTFEIPSFEMKPEEVNFEVPSFEIPDIPSFEMTPEEISFEVPSFENTLNAESNENKSEDIEFNIHNNKEVEIFSIPQFVMESEDISLKEEDSKEEELQIAPSQFNFENSLKKEEEFEISPTPQFQMEEHKFSNLDEMFNNASKLLINLIKNERNLVLENTDFRVK